MLKVSWKLEILKRLGGPNPNTPPGAFDDPNTSSVAVAESHRLESKELNAPVVSLVSAVFSDRFAVGWTVVFGASTKWTWICDLLVRQAAFVYFRLPDLITRSWAGTEALGRRHRSLSPRGIPLSSTAMSTLPTSLRLSCMFDIMVGCVAADVRISNVDLYNPFKLYSYAWSPCAFGLRDLRSGSSVRVYVLRRIFSRPCGALRWWQLLWRHIGMIKWTVGKT